ncbi:MAG: DUF4157 domain-containing protein, partial [Ilumatobacteraceae bacterium]
SATRINRSMRSVAATTGSDIFFSEGAYDPASAQGQRLLAHELTHVVQQGGAGVTPYVQRLSLKQAKRDIAEDQMTLKAEYFSARSEKRDEDLAAIMKLQTSTAVRPEAIMMVGSLQDEVPEAEVPAEEVPEYTQPIATALFLDGKGKAIADRFEAEYVPGGNPAISPALMIDLRALGSLKIHAQVGRASVSGGNSMQYWFRVSGSHASMGEWHVHWNARRQAGSPGWKTGRKGAKTDSGDEMRKVLGDLWGVAKNSGNGNWV